MSLRISLSIFAKKDIQKTKKTHNLRGRNCWRKTLQSLFCEFPHSYNFGAKKSRKTYNFPQPSEFPGSSAQNRISVDKISTKNMRQNCTKHAPDYVAASNSLPYSLLRDVCRSRPCAPEQALKNRLGSLSLRQKTS